ncbi:MAG: DUF1064 domain-containing protein [Pseudomonadota bacterium]
MRAPRPTPGKRSSKYGNHEVTYFGHTFPSKKEGNRYLVLRDMVRRTVIKDLVLHPKFEFVVNGVKVGRYTADFSYRDKSGDLIVEDVKSEATRRARDWPLRRNLMLACFGITVREI